MRSSCLRLTTFFPHTTSLPIYNIQRQMTMQATSERVQITLPNKDLSLLRTISRRMGWSVHVPRKSGIEKGLEDIRKGNVFHAKDSEDLIKQILG